ncbi:MAG: hypothetical protein FJ109_20070, partial [Deltaproteobacteria bacterium]|nr:hypothetical protein [Deltaproteobacteria bacterium]
MGSLLGRVAHSRLIPPAVLAGIYVYLLALLIPFLRSNNLMQGDGAGHLALVEFTAEHLLPFGSGWCDRVWTGFPAGQLYPPLFHVLAGALSYLVGSVFAIKLLICATWLVIPGTLYFLSGHLAQRGRFRCPLLQASLLLVTWSGVNVPSNLLGAREALGTNLESSVANGMYPSALGFLFFVLVLLLLVEPKRPRPVLLGLALAAAVLSHPVWAMLAAAAAVAAAVRDLLIERRMGLFARYALAALLSSSLSAFFVVPMLAHSDLMDPIHLPSKWGSGVWAMAATAAAVIGWRWKRMPRATHLLAVLGLAVVLVVAAGDRLELPFHLFRLTVPMMFLLLPALFAAVHFQHDPVPVGEDTDSCATPPPTGDGRVVPLLRFGNFVMALVLTGIFHAAQVGEMKGNPDLPRLRLPGYERSEGRIMALAEELHTPGYMALPYGVVRAGGAVSHGISVESASAAQAVVGLVTRLNPGVYTWGVDNRNSPVLKTPDPDLNLGRRQLDLLGFSHLLTDRVDRIPPWAKGGKAPVTHRFPNFVAPSPAARERLGSSIEFSRDGAALVFRLHPLGGGGLVDSSLPFLGVPVESWRKYAMLWFANGGLAPVPTVGFEGQLQPDHTASARVTHLSDSGDRLEIARSGGGPFSPLYVKIPWHPHWTATGEDGSPSPLYRAGLGMLLLAPPGTTTLEYVSGWCDVVGRSLTP